MANNLIKPTTKIFNFFDRFTVSTSNFSDTPVSWNFISCGIALLNEGASGNIVEYSFDGVNVHGDMDPDKPTAGMMFDARHLNKLYLRLKSGTSAAVRVEVWA